jgi:hypothetical protein
MTERSFQTAIAAMCFCMVSIVAGAWTLEAAATINAHQERQAETLCKVDPSYCGLRR